MIAYPFIRPKCKVCGCSTMLDGRRARGCPSCQGRCSSYFCCDAHRTPCTIETSPIMEQTQGITLLSSVQPIIRDEPSDDEAVAEHEQEQEQEQGETQAPINSTESS